MRRSAFPVCSFFFHCLPLARSSSFLRSFHRLQGSARLATLMMFYFMFLLFVSFVFLYYSYFIIMIHRFIAAGHIIREDAIFRAIFIITSQNT